jgi:protein disulfide-isomerase A6
MKFSLPLFVLALAPSLALGAIFPSNSHVQMLDPKSFKKAMKTNVNVSVVRATILLLTSYRSKPAW